MSEVNIKYVGGKEASKILGVHQRTLYQWDEKKLIETIRTPGGKRLYNVSKYLEEHSEFKNKKSDDFANLKDEDDEKVTNTKFRCVFSTVIRSFSIRKEPFFVFSSGIE
jgi:hypothetical protein